MKYMLREILLNIAQLSTARQELLRKALDEIYRIYMLLHPSDLKKSANLR